jgi:hypothetical protein
MRQVEIIEEIRNQRPWVAVDTLTRKPVLRMQRLETLLTISRSLGWDVLPEATADRPQSVSMVAA